MKEATITILAFVVVLLLAITITDNCTGRHWNDGIIKAERHHMMTGRYYNQYSKQLIINSKKDTIVNYILEKQASFDKTYWQEINPNEVEE